MSDQAARLLPLSPQTFQILLSLADGPRHGYEIIQDVRARTNDEVRLTASTLYDALARLLDDEVIDELDRPPAGQPADGRRRYYRLTPLGRSAAALEARRLERLIEMARDKRLLPAARSRGRR
ncbi:MAG TPA: PadR family transcriptional regulator [Vicinamibacterales bacterium]|jgi:DNA-binding PadR family transcriptional regulator|nr:PadR family transcriptional regulator [Vicinamibacterales bacterium]